ncbi:5-methyltetrahydrofolate--homocysteine methyltransferase [Candidatus Nitrosotalea sp. TS]|uniref:homocysteine S-methyltransferase family protein n=1 Tax=Candidatus Nitrosotalea sp. TS TaxID=2341020 RepID=UPI001ECCD5B3|nr:homocysteine S-methyltransferase family protein [Candidatus Nitrosotalea sp. TS]NHI03525.1 5-methyltetrahydrofolate--homocysteine methyltransferase [Candidatus Nitrosotalea sp. TS]
MTTKIPLADLMKQKIVLFDGAMGTEIQKLNPNSEDFPDGKDGFNDGLSFTRPEWIKNIHRNYLKAGADCIETNTFGSNKLKLEEYGYGDKTLEFNKKIAELAVDITKEFSDKPRYVVGSMGPTGFLPSSNDPSLGQIPLEKIREAFEIQAEGLILGGVDALLIETSQDILEVKMAIDACHSAMKKTGKKIPIIANVTLDKYGKMLLGTNIQAAYTTVSDMGIDAFGLNCSTGPVEMTPSIRWLNEQNDLPLLVVPNAGMPENQGGRAVYKMTPEDMAKAMRDFISQYGNVRIIGGCCGTNTEHIALLRKIIDEKQSENKR